MKRILIIGIVILVVIAAALTFMFSSSEDGVDFNEADLSQNPNLTLEAKKLVTDNVVSPVSSYNKQAIWYGSENGHLFRMDLLRRDSTEYMLPSSPVAAWTRIIWPSTGNDFIVVGRTGSADRFYYYSDIAKEYKQLPANMKDVQWMPDGKRIASIWVGSDAKASLVVSDADGTNFKILKGLPWTDMVMKVSPAQTQAVLYRTASSDPVNKLYLFDLNSGEYQEVATEGNNAGSVWSPDGKRFVYGKGTGTGSELHVYDIEKKKSTDLKVKGQIDRVSFTEDGFGVYYVNATSQGNQLMSVDVSRLTTTNIYTFAKEIIPARVIPIELKLFFISQDNKLYVLEQEEKTE